MKCLTRLWEGVGEKEQKRRSEASGAYLQACPRDEGSRGGYGIDAQSQARWEGSG